jgi:mannosyltransferase OCH1-like enzyme
MALPIMGKLHFDWMQKALKKGSPNTKDLVDVRSFYLSPENLRFDTIDYETTEIPKRVFQTWKTSHIDQEHAKKLKEFQEKNKGYEFYFFDDSDMDAYMKSRWKPHNIFKIYQNTLIGAARADIWRYCLLHDVGGIYLDIDAAFKISFDEIIKDSKSEIISYEGNKISNKISRYEKQIETRILSYEEFWATANTLRSRLFPYSDHVVLQWALFFKPKHPILSKTLSNIVEISQYFEGHKIRNMHKAVCNFTGPVTYSRAVWDYALNHQLNHRGIDFFANGLCKSVPKNGTYSTDQAHYTKLSNQILLPKIEDIKNITTENSCWEA